MNMVYLYGEECNADEFITDGSVAPQGIAAWIIGEQLSFDIPVKETDGTVTVRLHVQETYQGTSQNYIAIQDEKGIATEIVPGNSVSDFVAQVKNGHCKFTLQFETMNKSL